LIIENKQINLNQNIKGDFTENLNYNNSINKVETDTLKTEEKKLDKQYNKKELDTALNKLNKFLEDDKTHAEYSYHEDLGTLMIKIIKDETEEVVLEVPPENILDLVANICKGVGILDDKA